MCAGAKASGMADTVITGTASGDFMVMQGDLQHMTMTLTNPYTGETVNINDVYKVNNAAYDGLGGTDALLMSEHGDMLFIKDADGDQTLKSIEQIIAGDGGDVIVLADADIQYGNVAIDGGGSGDIIWSNNGNDTIFALDGNDIVDGGGGLDRIYGGWGSDYLRGGDGDDIIYGGSRNDAEADYHTVSTYEKFFTITHSFPTLNEGVQIAPDQQQYLGYPSGETVVTFTTTATLKFVSTDAGYKNTVGVYTVDPDGTIRNADFAFMNARATASGTSHEFEISGAVGVQIGLFMIANGYNANGGYGGIDMNTGTLNFYYNFGQADQRLAKVTDDGDNVSLIWSDGTTDKLIAGTIYHSSASDGSSSLNRDDNIHVITGLANAGDNTTLRLGFEDQDHLGDADFNDVIVDLQVETQVVETILRPDDDILYGDAGNDTLYGGFGNDVLNGGTGSDHLYGGQGADTFVFDNMDGFVDTVHDFKASEGDVLDISDILSGYDDGVDDITDFLKFVQNGSNVDLYVNADGDSGGAFDRVAVIVGGVGGASVQDLLDGGAIVAAQTAV